MITNLSHLITAIVILIWVSSKAILAWKRISVSISSLERYEIMERFCFDVLLLLIAIVVLVKM